jgi:hypothetical protein
MVGVKLARALEAVAEQIEDDDAAALALDAVSTGIARSGWMA